MSALDDLIKIAIETDIPRLGEQAAAELTELRAENKRKDKAFQLAVAECVKACQERDVNRRNWENTMAHRDRLNSELAELCAALDEVKRLMSETIEAFSGHLARTSWIRQHEAIDAMKKWLEAHPKEGEK